MEFDLNQEPFDPTHGSVLEFDSMLDELESGGHGHIQDRIRHLEAVTSRARQRRAWPLVHSPIQITNFTGEATTTGEAQGEGREQHEVVEEGIVENGKGGRNKGTHLIAKALGVEEIDASNGGGRTGNFYDCNICLDTARYPVLTCCGHLFCWPCFYQLPYAYSNAKECPNCKGEVNETDIIPIYVNASDKGDCQLESKEAGLKVPPRPKAPRIEGIRQQLINQGTPSAIVQNIQRFNNLIGGFGGQVQSESPNTAATDRNNVLHIQSRPQMGNNRRTGSRPISRLLVQSADSFSSFSSALNYGQRIVEDFESYMHSLHIGGSRQLNGHAVNRNSTSRVAATNRSESLARDVSATSSAAAAFVSSINRTVDAITGIGSEMQTTDGNLQIGPLDPSSYNRRRRRRRNVSRQASNGPGRRRLR